MIKIEFNSEMEKQLNQSSMSQTRNFNNNVPLDSLLYHNNSNINILNIDISHLIKYLPKIFTKHNLIKYFTNEDLQKLKTLLPSNSLHISNEEIIELVTNITKDNNIITLFQQLLRKNYFSYVYINIT